MKDIFKLGYQQRIFPLEKHVNSGTKPDENIVHDTTGWRWATAQPQI